MNAINGPVECMQRCVAEAIQEVIDLTGFLCFLFRSTPTQMSQISQMCQMCQMSQLCQMSQGRFFWVRSCLLITLIKSLKGHKSLGLLFNVEIKRCVSESVSDKVTY